MTLAGHAHASSDPGRVIEADQGDQGPVDYYAADARIVILHGDSAAPFAMDGQGVLFDAGRPGGVDDGELIVVELEHEVVVKRRQTAGGFRQYVSVNSAYPTITVELDDVPNEYPVLGVILKPRRSSRHRPGQVRDRRPEYWVGEDEGEYPR